LGSLIVFSEAKQIERLDVSDQCSMAGKRGSCHGFNLTPTSVLVETKYNDT